LALVAGVPLVVRVLQCASKSKLLSEVIVACDDRRIADAVERSGGRAILTQGNHATGSDRAAEVAAKLDCDYIVNIQGDEPFIDPQTIDRIVGLLAESGVVMSTACSPLAADQGENPNIVKVVLNTMGDALYFSRSRIPFQREDDSAARLYRHIGIYGFKRDFLLKFSSLTRGPLEMAESLEQLRALEHGYKIRVAIVESDFVGIDSMDDVARAEEIVTRQGLKNAK